MASLVKHVGHDVIARDVNVSGYPLDIDMTVQGLLPVTNPGDISSVVLNSKLTSTLFSLHRR